MTASYVFLIKIGLIVSDRFALVELPFEFFPARLDEHGAVGEDDGDGWYTAVAVVDLHDEFGGFVVPFDTDVEVGDVVNFEEFLGAQAIDAELGCVHHNLCRS